MRTRLPWLTARERDVMERVVARKRNRAIAFELGVGIKTVEDHRARAMEKMVAESLPELTAPCILCGRYTGKP